MFNFTIMCDEQKIFDGKVSSVSVETVSGVVEILHNHQPYMARIRNSVIYTQEDRIQASVRITDGFIYTDGSRCVAIVDDTICSK
jgi:F0F1-type ATP synthase epsilon subunit